MPGSKRKSIDSGIGRRIAYIREARSPAITQKDLAASIGMDASYLAKIENGRLLPSVKHLLAIAEALDVAPAVFFQTDDVAVIDLVRLPRKYRSKDDLSPALYMKVHRVFELAKRLGFS